MATVTDSKLSKVNTALVRTSSGAKEGSQTKQTGSPPKSPPTAVPRANTNPFGLPNLYPPIPPDRGGHPQYVATPPPPPAPPAKTPPKGGGAPPPKAGAPPVAPFLTPDQFLQQLKDTHDYQSLVDSLNRALSNQKAGSQQQIDAYNRSLQARQSDEALQLQGLNRNAALSTRNTNDALAGRGLFGSSIQQGDIADIEANRSLRQQILETNLKAYQSDVAARIAATNTASRAFADDTASKIADATFNNGINQWGFTIDAVTNAQNQPPNTGAPGGNNGGNNSGGGNNGGNNSGGGNTNTGPPAPPPSSTLPPGYHVGAMGIPIPGPYHPPAPLPRPVGLPPGYTLGAMGIPHPNTPPKVTASDPTKSKQR